MGTVRADDPRLDARDVDAVAQPRRLAFGRGPLPEGSELELRSGPLEEELRALGGEGVQSLLLEGGPTLATAFLEPTSSTSCSSSSPRRSPARARRSVARSRSRSSCAISAPSRSATTCSSTAYVHEP